MLTCNDECRVSRMFGRQHATQDRVYVISFPTIQVQSLARRDICWYVFPWRVHKCGITGTIARDDQVHTNCKKRRLALIHSLSAQSSAGSGNIGRKRACSSTSNGQSRRTMRWRSCRRPSSSQTWMERNSSLARCICRSQMFFGTMSSTRGMKGWTLA